MIGNEQELKYDVDRSDDLKELKCVAIHKTFALEPREIKTSSNPTKIRVHCKYLVSILSFLWSLLVIPDLVKITNMKRRVSINQQVFNPMKYSEDINWVLADRFCILRDEKSFI